MCIEEGKRWLILLDQDTHWSPGVLQQYYEATLQYPEGLIFAPVVRDTQGIVSPFFLRFARGVRIKSVIYGPVSLTKYKVINSGMLIRSDAFQEVGGYEESLPLDFSDLAFLIKFQALEEPLIVINAELQQNLSGSIRQDHQKTLDRFKIYCEATQTMSRITGDKFIFWSRALVRAILLTWRYGDFSFLKIHYRLWH